MPISTDTVVKHDNNNKNIKTPTKRKHTVAPQVKKKKNMKKLTTLASQKKI